MTPEDVYSAAYQIYELLTAEDGPEVGAATLRALGLMQRAHTALHQTPSPSPSP